MEYYEQELSSKIISAAIEVHKNLGPGLLESSYAACLSQELDDLKIQYKKELNFPLSYKGKSIEVGYRLDYLIEDKIILELKSVEKILPVHKSQILTYLKLTNKRLGLLINFNVVLLKEGINRIIL